MTASSSFAIDVSPSLLARARAGDRAAFEQLYRWFERPVFTLALRMCGSRSEADEILQETMLKLWSGIGGFRGDGGSPFWGWLRQVAVNEALMRLRRERRLALELDGVDADDIADDPELAARYKAAKEAVAAQPMSESARRGRDIFFTEKGNCTACHVGANLADEKYHNIGIGRHTCLQLRGAWHETCFFKQAGDTFGIVDIHLASVGADVVGALRRHNRSRVCRALPSHGIRRNTRAKGRVGPHDRPGSLGPLDEGL